MARLLLFSAPSEEIIAQLTPYLFPTHAQGKTFAYMPCEGLASTLSFQRAAEWWQRLAAAHQMAFQLIDNAVEPQAAQRECEHLRAATTLLITGGNSCVLLRNLLRSGLFDVITTLAHSPDIILAGYSAGAMIFTPSVQIGEWDHDHVGVGLTDFTALHLVEYEIWPHFTPAEALELDRYRQGALFPVRPLTDAEYLLIDL